MYDWLSWAVMLTWHFFRGGNFSRGKRLGGMSRGIVVTMQERECTREFVCQKCN